MLKYCVTGKNFYSKSYLSERIEVLLAKSTESIKKV